MTYLLTIAGEAGPRAKLDLDYSDVMRIAQGLANTEGVRVGVIGGNTIRFVEGDEGEHPNLTLEERTWIVDNETLWQMHADAKDRQAHAQREEETIMNEILRRAGHRR